MSKNPKTVALTGATGFIGRHLLRSLLEKGFRVKILVRPGSREKIQDLLGKGAVFQVEGDLFQEKALEELVEGCQVLVHLAGAVRGEDFETFARVNAKGFWKLLQTIRKKSSPPGLLLVSSLAARHPYLSPYAASKRLAEEMFLEVGLPGAIFRPPAVYGPGDRELSPLIRLILKGFVPLLGEENRFSLIHVYDLSQAMVKWIENPIYDKIYELHDGHPGGYSWREVAEIARRVRKGPVRLIRISPGILRPLGILNQGVAKILARPPMLTPGKINELFHHHWVCDNSSIERDLHWKPQWDLEKGLRSFLEKV